VTIGSVPLSALYGVLIFPPLLIAAALCDIATLKIPNIIPALLVATFLPLAFLAHLKAAEMGWHVAIASGALLFGVIAFGLGWMGGGDGKLLAACALWLGPADILPFAIAFSLIGGALAFLLLTMRRLPVPAVLLKRSWIMRLWAGDAGIPYAVAFAAAGLLQYPHSEIWQRLAGA
jgi:prepilin peptidase CpaA